MARRIKSLHQNLQDGENVVFHREHRSKKGRAWKQSDRGPVKPGKLQKFERKWRRKWKSFSKSRDFYT